MEHSKSEPLPPELELACAHTPQFLRERLAAYFGLDVRLGRIVAGTTEPILGQMRLAWWRDMLRSDPGDRPTGDAVLDAIGEHWADDATALVPLVDGWEELLVAEQLGEVELARFTSGRAQALQALIPPEDEQVGARVHAAAQRYAFADTAVRLSDPEERDFCIDCGLAVPGSNSRLPRELRGLAVLEALSLRSLKNGARPLMEGRGAAITAFRAAFFRR